MRAAVLVSLAGLSLAGCATLRAYDGPPRAADEVAVVAGDPRFHSAPLTLVLRTVDGRSVPARYNAVEILPGQHEFVVDCRLRENNAVSRHELSAEIDPGMRYGFTAELAPGMRGCASVELQQRH